MHVVSYRGPGAAGGVSSGLKHIWLQTHEQNGFWWFTDGHAIKKVGPGDATHKAVNLIDERTTTGHYRYCNEFLWPVLHDMPHHARYYPGDRESYRRFNSCLAQLIAGDTSSRQDGCFIQDYQLALLPLMIKLEAGCNSTMFWHIPWPLTINAQHIEPLAALAKCLLASKSIGFHIEEYADNFMKFIEEYLPAYHVDRHHGLISSGRTGILPNAMEAHRLARRDSSSFVMRPLRRITNDTTTHTTNIVVYPLPIDTGSWRSLSQQRENSDKGTQAQSLGIHTDYVLSVDRVDYTKGIRDRLHAIHHFLSLNPKHVEKLTFLQISGRSRTGVQSFDSYWDDCRALANEINNRWQTGEWQPIKWHDQMLTEQQLACLYKHAQAMLVTSVRDGLNLTAGEYVTCQDAKEPGVLLLSNGTGAFQLLKEGAVELNGREPRRIAQELQKALYIDSDERRQRLQSMQSTLQNYTADSWWSAHTRFLSHSPIRHTEPGLTAARHPAQSA